MATKEMTFTSKGILNALRTDMELTPGPALPEKIGIYVPSDEEVEHYTHFGAVPRMGVRGEGGRPADRPKPYDWQIRNLKYTAGIDIPLDWLRRDKTGEVVDAISSLAQTANSHWLELTTSLLEGGVSSVCYDGQYFFDTDHAESGTNQSNDITVDISALPIPTDRQGTVTAPGVETMRAAIFAGIKQLLSLKDDKGRPINQNAMSFAVHVPLGLWDAAGQALGVALMGAGNTNPMATGQVGDKTVTIELFPNAWSAWDDEFSVHITGGKSIVLQEEVAPTPVSKADGTDYEVDNDAWFFGIDTIRAAGYGRWQHGCLVTLV